MKYVIGGTYQDYKRWLYELRLAERDALFIGTDEERLMGLELSEDDIVRFGYGSPRFEEILRTRIRK